MTAAEYDLKFSHDYSKLDAPFFTTIRRQDRYPTEGTLIKIKTPTRIFFALIALKIKMRLGDLSTALLCFDTGEGSRSHAFDLLGSFYKTPIRMDEKVTILFLVKHATGLEVEQQTLTIDKIDEG